MVIDQTPRLMRRTKLPIVKAKIGPRIMVLVADERVYDLIPLKKEVKATVSGIYITEVRGVRGALEAPPKKQKFFCPDAEPAPFLRGLQKRFQKRNSFQKHRKIKRKKITRKRTLRDRFPAASVFCS